ncbi:hypothetical protein B0T10DRAFT_443012 [Thelonectria olida]|uniref:Peptidase M20 dimerisation domain-containing protein n=1 Tax=Thelonectria olida TaxID=1576542 RepID=A0A9P8W1T4_9HYPO|nr:hypothetical protein B0T10DRAFT_443012 [Thelonectria olida]
MKTTTSFVSACLAGWAISAAVDVQQPLLTPRLGPSLSSLLDLHKSLVQRPSITGSEANVSEFLTTYLRARGFTVEGQPVDGDRENVFAYLHGSRSTRVLVTSHIDTVPPYWPYERRGDELWGRGTVDAKGSVAAQIIAVESLLHESKISQGDIALLFVVGEETGGAGMRAANELGLSWESVIFGEPTELKLARGHKGAMGFTVKAKGKAGHSGYPETGRNAIDLLVQGLAALKLVELPWSEDLGNTTINVGKIEGGFAPNVIPANASATAVVRIASGSPKEIQKLVRDALGKVSSDIEVEFTAGIGPVPIDYDIDGFETIAVSYGTDIPSLGGHHKRYLFGPGSILEAHSAHEHLKISDLEDAVNGYKTLITESLKRNASSN